MREWTELFLVFVWRVGLSVTLVLGCVAPSGAQIPQTFTNLQVLSADIGQHELTVAIPSSARRA